MDLLDRYLNAIKPLLPRRTQQDILRELSDDILTQIEEKEVALGRALTEAEQEEVIKRYGHPIVVAARYGRTQYLIGPSMFPVYWLVLKIASIGGLIMRWIIAMVAIASSRDPAAAIAPEIFSVPFVLVPVFAWVTAAFAVAEVCGARFHIKVSKDWNPRSLPVINREPGNTPRVSSIFEILFGGLFVVWWQSVPPAATPLPGIVMLAPIWAALHWPILLLAVFTIAQSVMNLVRPQLTPAKLALRLFTHVWAFVIACVLLSAGNWIVVAPALHDAGRYATLARILNQTFLYSIVTAMIIIAVQFGVAFVRYGPRFFHGCGARHGLRRA